MAANASDLVRNATPNFATTLANSMLISDTSLTLSSGTGLPTATGITLVIDATNSAGTYTPTVMEVVTGTLSGTTLSNLKRGLDGSTQQGHASGANVVMWITANLWNDWQTAFLLGHSQLTGAHVANLPLTTPQITTGLKDANGNTEVGFTATGSAVNNLNVANAATANAPVISAVGSDTNIGLTLTPKGSGALTLNGISGNVSTQSNAGTGGGTLYYINLGGIKLCWGQTATHISYNYPTYTITLPTSFFSSIQSVEATYIPVAGDSAGFAYVSTATTTTVTYGMGGATNTSSDTGQIFILVIGT